MFTRRRRITLALLTLCVVSAAVPAKNIDRVERPSAEQSLLTALEAPPPATRIDLSDLSSYYVSPKQQAAKEAFDQGRYALTLKLLESEGDAEWLRYLRALCDMK